MNAFGAFGAGAATAFAIALLVFAAASIAAAGDFAEVDRNSGREFERAAASVDAAKAALQAFDQWRHAEAQGAALRRTDTLEQRFRSLLNRAEQRAASTPTRAAAAAIRVGLAQWRSAKPLDARFAELEPALEEARAVQLRLQLSLMVETAVTQSLFVQRAAATTVSRAKWTSIVAVFAACAAAGLFLFGAARVAIRLIAGALAAEPRRTAAPSVSIPVEPYAAEETRRKAAARLAAMRSFEADRRVRADMPFALRGAAPALVDG